MKNITACLFLIVIGIIFNFATLRGIYGNPPASSIKDNLDKATKPFELSPERGRFLLTQNLSEHNSFALSKDQADAASPDVGYYKGNYFIFFAPGISIFALPFYNFGLQFNLSQVFSFSMVSLFAIMNLVFIFLVSKQTLRLPIWASLLASIIYGFGSVAWSYSGTLYQHQSTVFFIISSFYAVWQYKIHKKWGWIWGFFIWTNYALAILIDYPNVLLMLPVMIYFLLVCLKIKKEDTKYRINFRLGIILTSIFFIIITGLHLYYNQVNFGGWFHVSGNLLGIKTISQYHLDRGDVEENIKKMNAIASKKSPVRFFKEDLLVSSSNELLFAMDKGIFIFNPVFILGVIGIFYAFKKMNLEKAILVSLVIVNLFLYSSWGDPWGGWAFGPRYLIPSMAILSIFIAYGLSVTSHKIISKIIAYPLIAFSVGVSLLGAVTTNQVPPNTEAVYLKTKDGFIYNLAFLKAGSSSSFVFNNYFKNQMSLLDYYSIIFWSVMIIIFIILFIMPLFDTKHWEEKK